MRRSPAPHPAGPRRRRRRPDRGTALIETVMVATLLMSLVTATFELGMGWRSASTNANAARAGARVASSQGVANLADHATILAVMSGLRSTGNVSIRKIVIFRSASATGDVPNGCLTASSSTNKCNLYSATQVASITANPSGTQANFAGTCSGTTQWDRSWCPSTRNNVQLSTGGLDYVGVYVEISHPTFSNMFGTSITIKDTSVMRIEPSAGSTT